MIAIKLKYSYEHILGTKEKRKSVKFHSAVEGRTEGEEVQAVKQSV